MHNAAGFRNGHLFILVLIVFVWLTPSPVHGQQVEALILDPVEITLSLNRSGPVLLSFSGHLTNTGDDPVVDVAFRIESTDLSLIDAQVSGSPVTASSTKLERYSLVTLELDENLVKGSGIDVSFRVAINDMQTNVGYSIEDSAQRMDCIYYLRPLFTYRNITVLMMLPEYSSLSKESVSPLFPSPCGNFTDGQSLVFYWMVPELVPGQERVFIVRYQAPVITGQADAMIGIELLIAGIVFLSSGIIVGLFIPRIVSKIRDLRKVRYVGVTSEEEEVLEAIRKKGGSCSQKELYSDLGLSQAKVSLLLTALEERGLVRRFKEGRENVVHIIEE